MLVFLMIASLFGYTVYQVDRTAVDGEINVPALRAEISEDIDDITDAFKAADTANHNRYND